MFWVGAAAKGDEPPNPAFGVAACGELNTLLPPVGVPKILADGVAGFVPNMPVAGEGDGVAGVAFPPPKILAA